MSGKLRIFQETIWDGSGSRTKGRTSGRDMQGIKKEYLCSELTQKVDMIGLTHKKDANFEEWYSEVVVNAEMIEHYDIFGCYILQPWTMAIWEAMRDFFGAQIKKLKIQNCYFPVFVLPNSLQKEKDHFKGFAPEAKENKMETFGFYFGNIYLTEDDIDIPRIVIAWVTKSGQSDLEVPIAIRPTSETLMCSYFSKWIRGHHDLPLRLNQWCNVVRWESNRSMPFIRNREFLWQEGHTAFATQKEADTEVVDILELYRQIYEDLLSIPVIKGKKSELEKFAGGFYSTSVEAFIPNVGRGVEGATSNFLGQNFAEVFGIKYENEKRERKIVWQNSWAFSTRTIGVMVMTHADDNGLVLPPKIAPIQVIVVPAPLNNANVDTEAKCIFDVCASVVETLAEAGIRAEVDLRHDCSPSWKHSNWQMKGVPLRLEIAPKDLAYNQICAVRRDNMAKKEIPMANLITEVQELLDLVQKNLFELAKQRRDACVQIVRTWDEFIEALAQKKLIFAPWCDEEDVEKDVQARTKGEMGAAKTLCSPFDQPQMEEGTLCFVSGKPAKIWTYWGRSY